MNMKSKTLLALLLIALASPTLATNPKPKPPPPPQAEADADARAHADADARAGAAAGAHSDATGGAGGHGGDGGEGGRAYSTGGDATGGIGIGEGGNASNDGVQVSDNSQHNFLALSLMFPNASGCFKGVQGGGDDKDNFAGFLGFHWLDKNCWSDTLANRERDADINARLKCAGKHFRNAIAFDVKGSRRVKQQACVDRVAASNRAMIAQENERLQKLIDKQTTRINSHTSLEHDGTRRAVETCTDCYGERSK